MASVAIGTMHLAKGLEFKCVTVMACDDEVIPSQDRIEGVADDADLQEVYNTERHLLYVACTRDKGDDSLAGGEGYDTFVFGLSSGQDMITDLVCPHWRMLAQELPRSSYPPRQDSTHAPARDLYGVAQSPAFEEALQAAPVRVASVAGCALCER